MLAISKLKAGYEDLQVLKDVSLELPAGKVGVLMGPNGAGKSTLLKAIFNVVKISSGSVTWNGEELTNLPAYELLTHGIAYVPQGKINFGLLTVEENLFMGAYHLASKDDVAEHLKNVYQQFPALKAKQHQYAFTLSGGQQQMLALGRAMMMTPQLLLLDEPSLGLSPRLVKEVFAKIRRINEQFGTTILIVEHNIRSVMDIADLGFILVHGDVIEHGSRERLLQSKTLEQVFVGKFE